jgi:transcriptional regulator with GAF, ATPase, and Fis domain
MNSVPDGESFSIIKGLKHKDLKIVSYEDKVFSWPIGTRCRALLNGSFLLLDSNTETYVSELQTALTNVWRSETERDDEERRMKEQMRALRIIGESPQMLSVFRWVTRVSALSDFPVLINGETGTGKELIANALHRLDIKRSKGPFVAANCGAISADLAESELFGHRKGAFTGADTDRKGLFRSAEGGVLFLDEIGELSQSLQAKLLRALQEERVLGVGYDREVAIDVRVIAATNKDLEAMVREGTFREDLFHRLNVLSVSIPPLRERREDLRPLTEHFVWRYSPLNVNAPRTVNPEFLEALGQMRLPGNARQLENIVRRALLNGAGKTSLSLSDLTSVEWEQLANEEPVTNGNGTTSSTDSQPSFLKILDSHGWNLGKSLEYCERALLECALRSTGGNQTKTARLMGITPRSVYNKLQKYKLRSLERE